METIEERYGNPQEPYCFETDREEQWYKCGQVAGATEQDLIARQEERERCIKAAQDAVCKVCAACYNITNCKKNGCGYFNNIRKAIEEGGEG